MKGGVIVWRARFLFLAIFAFALILIAKLYFVQIVSGEEFSLRADRQYLRPNTSVFNRGTIYFTSKNGDPVTAAVQQSGYTVAINPKILTNPEDAYNNLSSLLELDAETFLGKSAKKDDPYEVIVKRIDKATADKISSYAIPGVSIAQEKWRTYPGGEMAAHAVGLVGYKGSELAGRYGLESYYEDILNRENDSVYANFFAEIFSDVKGSITNDSKTEGDIVTSIEPSVESFLESELKKVNDTWQSDYSGGIIINPQTGEIYAMAVNPSFDPNAPQEEESSLVFSDPLVENVYEMGSIVKPLTMAVGIDSGAITPKTTYNDTGFITLNSKKISNYDGKARGVVPMQEVLSQSLNLGATFIMQSVGKEKFSQYFTRLGLGEKTGIDLPNEGEGLVENLKSPRDVEHATASFGQGIAMTPIETVRALSTLANGGKLITPHLASSINYKIGLSKKIAPAPGAQVFSKETTEQVSKMLVKVVDEALLKGTVKIPNYSVAAKTGTAQIPDPKNGGYYADKYLHSFFGYFPAYDAKFLIFLYTYYPKNVTYASETLTHTFNDITKFLINYYQVPPDR